MYRKQFQYPTNYLKVIFCVFSTHKSRNKSEFLSPNPLFERLFCARFGHFTHPKGLFSSLDKDSDGWKACGRVLDQKTLHFFPFPFTAHAHMRVACSCVRQMCVKCVLFPSHLTAKAARSRALSFIATVAQWGSATVTVVLATVTHQQQPLAPSLPPPPPSSSHPPAPQRRFGRFSLLFLVHFPPVLCSASRVDAINLGSKAKVCVLVVAGWSLGGVVLLARVFLCDVVACLLTLPFNTHIYDKSCAIRS